MREGKGRLSHSRGDYGLVPISYSLCGHLLWPLTTVCYRVILCVSLFLDSELLKCEALYPIQHLTNILGYP